jgi:release factor glutamine methyltransferase
MTLKQLEHHYINVLASLYGEEEAKQLFFLSAERIIGLSRSQLILQYGNEISEHEGGIFLDMLSQLKEGVPLQHITEEAWFYGLRFKVNAAVLIPRPETEELVQWVISTVSESKTPLSGLLDIGTGSGCIAITIKKNCPALIVTALDISAEALEVAAENAEYQHTQIRFIHSDILEYEGVEKYDIIVSNPPYITLNERDEMHRNVLEHEPALALFVTDDNPLLFYKGIADFATRSLKAGGRLFFEINEHLGSETVEMLRSKGFVNINLQKDMQGKDRMIRCSFN